MSLSGLFLITFLCVHLALNLLLIFDNSGELFNQGAHFMATNPLIKVVEPVLAIGFIIHIIWASVLTLQNQKARPVKYNKRNQSQNATWASRNMFIIGGLVLIFLAIHLYNFWWNIKFPSLSFVEMGSVQVNGVEMENTYAMVAGLFKEKHRVLCHLHHRGYLPGTPPHSWILVCIPIHRFSNDLWRKRLEWVAYLFAFIFAVGFSIIPLYFIAGLGN